MSTIALECKTCNARYKVPGDKGVSKIDCRNCGSSIYVPGARRTTGMSVVADVGDKPRSTKTRTSSGMTVSGISTKRRGSALSTYLLAGLALIAVVGGFFYLFA